MRFLRLFRTFVWLHWRQQVNALVAVRRSSFVRAASWLDLAVVVVIALLVIGASAGTFFGGLALGRAVAVDEHRAAALAGARLVLLLVTAMAVVFPAVRAGHGALGNRERLLLLPISRRTLHGLEVSTFLSDPWLLPVVPGVLALAAGAAGGHALSGLLAGTTGLLFIAALACIGSAATIGARLLFRQRRRAELVTFVALLLLILVSFIPAFLEENADSDREPGRSGTLAVDGEEVRIDASWLSSPPVWPWAIVPSEAFAATLDAAARREPTAGLFSLVVLAGTLVVAWSLSGAAWRRLAAEPASGSSRRRESSWHGRLPGLSGPAGAVATATVKTSLRTVQGKIAVVVPTLFLLVFSTLSEAQAGPFAGFLRGPSLLLAGGLISISSQQNQLLNQLGSEGSGLTLQLLAPLSSGSILRGKALGGVLLTTLSVVPAFALLTLFDATVSPAASVAAYLGTLAAFALYAPVAAWLSILFPKPADLGKIGNEGKPRATAVLIGFVSLIVVFLLPAGVGFGGLAIGGVWGSLLAEGLLLVLSLPVAAILGRSATAAFDLRREGIFLAARSG